MSTIEPLITYFNNFTPLDEEEIIFVSTCFKSRLYRKRQYILQEGDVCNNYNFVVRGCLRMYKIDKNGNTHILQFTSENGWIADIGSFHEHTPSELSIDALEDTIVLQISYENLIAIYERFPRFNRIFRILMENAYVSLQKRMFQNISSPAEDRYNFFMEVYPHLSSRLPQTQIASFLGITPEFLSRLRNRRLKNKS
ncbi:Crp/Fnr family transcriptional regulator [Pedobacter antarcticus]|uniref:Crp/Fnr family transcriptional regulator n=1 Tax=Pedobacter antarcticus TaxID=34086 RepID=UPI001C40B7D8|nr:Crp/Fnr family transcriptional regulator [Pedobacter antarcticus]